MKMLVRKSAIQVFKSAIRVRTSAMEEVEIGSGDTANLSRILFDIP